MAKNTKPGTRKPKAATAKAKPAPVKKDDPSRYPFLGRMLLGIDSPKTANKIFWGLAGLCVVLFALDFTYEKHGHFEAEDVPGFFGAYGFVMFTLLILAAKALRFFIKRPEGFYGDKAIDTEAYPEAGLERKQHDA